MKSTQISPILQKQIDRFIDDLYAFNCLRQKDRRRPRQDYDFLKDFFARYFADRNRRSKEVASSQYQEIIDLANKQFPVRVLLDLCMDGRVLPVLVAGASANICDSMRNPGGNLKEFVRGEDGRFKLLQDSNFAHMLTSAFVRLNTLVIAEVFDSHIGCAAVQTEELARGREPADGGLLHDILHKQEMAEATKEFVLEKIGADHRVIVIQTSFNPKSGFLYMGLETERALSFAKKYGLTKNGNADNPVYKGTYTSKALDILVRKGWILSTEKLANQSKLKKIFQDHTFSPNWKLDYVKTACLFWQNIAEFKKDALSAIIDTFEKIYPKANRDELSERAMIALVNAYSGFLHNLGEYPYSVHREELVAISEAGYTPNTISSFLVHSSDEKNLALNIDLASALVRSNRKEGRIKDRLGDFTSVAAFVQAPVPMIMQEIVRENLPLEKWEELSGIDWSDLPKNWDKMTDVEFLLYLNPKGSIPISVAMSIDILRKRMAIVFDPDSPTSSHLIAHHKVILSVIIDKNRYNYFIVPFVKHGFG